VYSVSVGALRPVEKLTVLDGTGDGVETVGDAALSAHPLPGLGELFAEAGFFFRRRQSPVTEQAPTAAMEPWSPTMPPATHH
jgi:hypothetical protein